MFEELYKAYPFRDFSEILNAAETEREKIFAERKAYFAEHHKLPEGTVIDEEKSVRWNREEVARCNKKYDRETAAFGKRLNAVNQAITQDIFKRVKDEYGFSDGVVNLILGRACESSHSDGEQAVLDAAMDSAEFLQDALRLMQDFGSTVSSLADVLGKARKNLEDVAKTWDVFNKDEKEKGRLVLKQDFDDNIFFEFRMGWETTEGGDDSWVEADIADIAYNDCPGVGRGELFGALEKLADEFGEKIGVQVLTIR